MGDREQHVLSIVRRTSSACSLEHRAYSTDQSTTIDYVALRAASTLKNRDFLATAHVLWL